MTSKCSGSSVLELSAREPGWQFTGRFQYSSSTEWKFLCFQVFKLKKYFRGRFMILYVFLMIRVCFGMFGCSVLELSAREPGWQFTGRIHFLLKQFSCRVMFIYVSGVHTWREIYFLCIFWYELSNLRNSIDIFKNILGPVH